MQYKVTKKFKEKFPIKMPYMVKIWGIKQNIMTWNYIKADTFFKEYLPHIKSYKHKIRGKNGRGNHIEFSQAEKKEIKAALKKLFKDLDSSVK